jgi:DNA-directed RNA polymerase subunit RPC12/RpoP
MTNDQKLEKMRYLPKWKCGNCGKEYTLENFLRLTIVKMVESDTDQQNEHGFVCDCGYRFFLDTLRIHDTIDIKTDRGYVTILVSTAFLELNHGNRDGKDVWFETMVFAGGFEDEEVEWLKCDLVHRYETKKEAIKDHDKIFNLLKMGKFKIEDYPYDEHKKVLIICDE